MDTNGGMPTIVLARHALRLGAALNTVESDINAFGLLLQSAYGETGTHDWVEMEREFVELFAAFSKAVKRIVDANEKTQSNNGDSELATREQSE